MVTALRAWLHWLEHVKCCHYTRRVVLPAPGGQQSNNTARFNQTPNAYWNGVDSIAPAAYAMPAGYWVIGHQAQQTSGSALRADPGLG